MVFATSGTSWVVLYQPSLVLVTLGHNCFRERTTEMIGVMLQRQLKRVDFRNSCKPDTHMPSSGGLTLLTIAPRGEREALKAQRVSILIS